jgi:Outer membrane protein beta-barrel family/Carboxypeptidase regulatory-like domain
MKNMKKILLLLALITSGIVAHAQKMMINGTVIDSAGKALESASVVLLNSSDSSLVAFGRSKADGTFLLRNAPIGGVYTLKITFVGYEPYLQDIPKETQKDKLDLGGIRMTPLSKMLDAATITAERDPIKIKGDTLEFNASSFKTEVNATTEDLLRKLPGIEVEKDGTVKAQGEQVKNVLVNGKKFFGSDPKLATQNLPAGAVDKVQVYDKKTDQAEFSGIDDGNAEKTINIQLKSQYNQGTFGNITAGAGSATEADDKLRFTGKGALNRFSKQQQISLLGMGNNINQQGFSFEDYMSYTGGAQRMAAGGGRIEINGNNTSIPLDQGRGTGFTNTYAGGGNFNQTFSPKTELNASYFYNRSDKITDRTVNRQNFLADRTFRTLQNSNQRAINDNHRVSLTFDHKLDSFNSIRLTSTTSYTENDNTTLSDTKTFGLFDSLQNASDRFNKTVGKGINTSNSLLFRHRFLKRGRTFSTNLNYNYSDNNRDGFLDATNEYYTPRRSTLKTLQDDDRINARTNFGVNVNYTEPLTKRTFLEFNYNYQKTANDAERAVNKIRNNERIYDTTLSNIFDNDFNYHKVGVNYRINQKEWNFSTGVQFQSSILRGRLVTKNSEVSRTFDYFLPNLRFKYDFTSSQSFVFDYDASVQEPSVDQMQPIRDNSDPLNISAGNEKLIPEYSHRLRFRYNKFDQLTFRSLFTNVNVRYTTDKITYAQLVDTNLVRTSLPVNVRNDLSINGNFNYGLPLNGQSLRLNFNSNMGFNQGIGLVNNIENITQRTNITGGVRFDWRLRDSFDLNLSAKVGYNTTNYSLQKALNQSYYTHEYEASFGWTIPFGMRIGSNFNYTFYAGQSFGGTQAIPIWQASLSKFILKNKRGEIKFAVNDILNRNLGFSRSTDINYIQDERINSLGRYFMLSFTYAINPMFGGAGGRRGPGGGGPIRIMQQMN